VADEERGIRVNAGEFETEGRFQMLRKFLLTTAAVMGLTAMAHADEVEVLHWWTSGGEAAPLSKF
jgi:hypothetical protein